MIVMIKRIMGILLAGVALLLSSGLRAQDVSFAGLPVFQPNQQPSSSYVPNDVDGSGVSDLLWFNPTTSQFGYWLMSVDSNGDVTRTGLRSFNVTSGYFVAATGDFNEDGRVDLVWTSANHDLYLWSSSGAGFQSTAIGSYPAGWNLIGAGDMDGDVHPDLLWWNASTHQFAYWLMKNGTRVGSRVFNISPGYEVVAIGYFGSSNRISLVWAGIDGDLYDWDSNGSGFSSYYIGSIARAYDPYTIDSVALRSDDLEIRTISGSEYQVYAWVRQFDSHGVQQSASFTNPSFGGRLANDHVSGFIYAPQFTGAYQSPLFVNTDIGDTGSIPTYLTINGPYQGANGVNANDSFVTGFPLGWYVIGATWYQSGQRAYGPTP